MEGTNTADSTCPPLARISHGKGQRQAPTRVCEPHTSTPKGQVESTAPSRDTWQLLGLLEKERDLFAEDLQSLDSTCAAMYKGQDCAIYRDAAFFFAFSGVWGLCDGIRCVLP